MHRRLSILLSTVVLSMGFSRAPQPSIGSQPNLPDLRSECISYHLQHHREDEQAANVVGFVEFTGYEILDPGEKRGGKTPQKKGETKKRQIRGGGAGGGKRKGKGGGGGAKKKRVGGGGEKKKEKKI